MPLRFGSEEKQARFFAQWGFSDQLCQDERLWNIDFLVP